MYVAVPNANKLATFIREIVSTSGALPLDRMVSQTGNAKNEQCLKRTKILTDCCCLNTIIIKILPKFWALNLTYFPLSQFKIES